ncbi:hypothetical protein [Nocardia stercoris]|uniref:Uncharacterized protein n=1 Tax=Nocardia stercoris TaxID=2483361 RepID=A0A3M2L9S9_9NOCA|nr:hypothetical protein [Nocardia stercoris]RMI34341.1 hypothetical protein EBN03_08120 [Nocardia stercoris]
MSNNTSGSAHEALSQAFSTRGYQMVRNDEDAATVFSPRGGKRIDLGPWLTETAELPLTELAGHAGRYADQAVRQLHEQRVPVDFDTMFLRVQIFPDEVVAGRGARWQTRPLAPGLVQAVVVDRPEGAEVALTGELDADADDLFGAAIAQSITGEDCSTSTQDLDYGTLTVIGGAHRYVGAQLHRLSRHVPAAENPFGALVAMPLPQYLLIYPIGQCDAMRSLYDLRCAATELFDNGSERISPQCYWWRPSRYEQLPESAALRSGLVPDLRPVMEQWGA